MTRPNNVTTDYTYDNLSRLLSVLHRLSGGTIDGATYTVDAVGNRTAKANLLPSAPAENYTYDAIYQLTQVVQNGSTTSENYTYDPVGNRLSSLAVSPWNYNVSNHLTAISGSPGTTFTYDNNGNTTSKTDASGTTTYTWDYENRLTSVTLPGSGGTVTFKYDPLGRRIQKASTSATTIYVYDMENIIEETNAVGAVQARFVMGSSVDEPLAQLRSGTTHFYSVDGLGSVTSLTSTSGALSMAYGYDSFGNLAASSGSVTNPFRYTAREFDVETGLYFYRARYYDQGPGRFLSEDPIGFYSGTNFYRYADNQSTMFTDPFGEDKCTVEVKCRSVGLKKIMLLRILSFNRVNPQHCYIGVTYPGSLGPSILSAGPDPKDSSKMTSGETPFDPNKKPKDRLEPKYNKNKTRSPKCLAENADCQTVDCLRKLAPIYQDLFPDYEYWGKDNPNSNSFVEYLTMSCGVPVKFPGWATGSDFHHKNPGRNPKP